MEDHAHVTKCLHVVILISKTSTSMQVNRGLSMNHAISAVCAVNEYVNPTSGVCAACPNNSTSAGGTPSMCTCNAGTGRVNETDVTMPCLGECQSGTYD